MRILVCFVVALCSVVEGQLPCVVEHCVNSICDGALKPFFPSVSVKGWKYHISGDLNTYHSDWNEIFQGDWNNRDSFNIPNGDIAEGGDEPWPETDVPAIQEQVTDWCRIDPKSSSFTECGYHFKSTCLDQSRILLTAEDGTKHCVKF